MYFTYTYIPYICVCIFFHIHMILYLSLHFLFLFYFSQWSIHPKGKHYYVLFRQERCVMANITASYSMDAKVRLHWANVKAQNHYKRHTIPIFLLFHRGIQNASGHTMGLCSLEWSLVPCHIFIACVWILVMSQDSATKTPDWQLSDNNRCYCWIMLSEGVLGWMGKVGPFCIPMESWAHCLS